MITRKKDHTPITLAHEWEQFAERVIPDTATAIQISEMKLAFYAGANIMQVLSAQVANTDNEVDGVAAIERLYNEAMWEMETMIAKREKGRTIL